MNPQIQDALIALIISGIIGGIIKVYFDYKSKLMENIWDKRLEAYMKFVQKTALFPVYPPKTVRWKEVYDLCLRFRDWYFEGNGLVVSTEFRNRYFALQEYLLDISKTRKESEEALTGEEYEDLRKRCSSLRSLMARELESRENPVWYRWKKKPEV